MSFVGFPRQPNQQPLPFRGSAGGHLGGRQGAPNRGSVMPAPSMPTAQRPPIAPAPMGGSPLTFKGSSGGSFGGGTRDGGMSMSASSTPSASQSASAFDDGGPVEDDTPDNTSDDTTGAIPETPPDTGGAQPNTPEAQANDEGFNQKVKDAGSAIYEGVMSIPQYLNLLMGKAGQYDQVWNNSTVRAITEAVKGVGQTLNAPLDNPNGQQPPLKGRGPSDPMMQGGLPGIGEGAAPDWGDAGKTFGRFGRALAQNFGADGEPVQPPTGQQPTTGGLQTAPGGVVTSGQQGSGDFSGLQQGARPQANPVVTGAAFRQPGQQQASNVTPQIQRLATMFQVDPSIVQQAHERYQSVGDYGKMLDYIAARSSDAVKHQYEMEKTKTIYQGKATVAAGHDASREQVATINGLFKDQNSQRQVMAQLQVAAGRTGVASDGNVVRAVDAFRNANPGADLPPELQQSMADVLVRAHNLGQGGGGGEGGGRGPVQIQTQGNPNAQQAAPTAQRLPNGKLIPPGYTPIRGDTNLQ